MHPIVKLSENNSCAQFAFHANVQSDKSNRELGNSSRAFFLPEGDPRMPYKPKRPCSHPGCPRLTEGRYCEEHAKEAARTYERHQRDPGTSRRYGSAWRKARSKFLAEHPFCELCRREGRLTRATVAHHIKATRYGGTDDEENLMALCQRCHSALHGRQRDRWNVKR